MPARVALITDRARPDGTADDALLRAVLPGAWFVPWEDGAPDADVVVIRSPWNYPQHAAAFAAWIDTVSAPMWNPASLLRWNLDKHYLDTLPAALGIPTRWITRDTPLRGLELPAVVKPAISAGGHDTWCVTADNADDVQGRLPAGDLLAQPLLAGVREQGELSLLFFGGTFSHAIRKLPAAGHFLVHEEHGGRVVAHVPTAMELRIAEAALAVVPGPWLYARVDLLPDGQTWRCVELEMIEPELFFRFSAEAPARFAAALSTRLSLPLR